MSYIKLRINRIHGDEPDIDDEICIILPTRHVLILTLHYMLHDDQLNLNYPRLY